MNTSSLRTDSTRPIQRPTLTVSSSDPARYRADTQDGGMLLKQVHPRQMLFMKHRGQLHRLHPAEIQYIKVEGKYCELHTNGGRFVCRKSLSILQSLLPDQFRLIHRSFLVNVDYVKKIDITGRAVFLQDGCLLPLSSKYLDTFQREFLVLS